MTTKAAFAPEEWTVVLEGPPTAGMIVITAAHGGTFRENHRHVEGLHRGTRRARRKRTARRDRVGEAEDGPHEVSLCRRAPGQRARAPPRRHGAAGEQGDRRGTR